jgi:Txe/YoeB family toxin of Txe-Axe toxin-antitoxin module
MTIDIAKLTKGQLAYETERAKKAGKSLEDWLKAKEKAALEAAKKAEPKKEKKPGFFSKLLDKAHKPI